MSSKSKTLTCSICIASYKDATILKCGHSYCEKCITDWLNRDDHCPTCRKVCNKKDLIPNYALRGDDKADDPASSSDDEVQEIPIAQVKKKTKASAVSKKSVQQPEMKEEVKPGEAHGVTFVQPRSKRRIDDVDSGDPRESVLDKMRKLVEPEQMQRLYETEKDFTYLENIKSPLMRAAAQSYFEKRMYKIFMY